MPICACNAVTDPLGLVADGPARSDEPTYRPSGFTSPTDCHARHVV